MRADTGLDSGHLAESCLNPVQFERVVAFPALVVTRTVAIASLEAVPRPAEVGAGAFVGASVILPAMVGEGELAASTVGVKRFTS